MLTLHRRPAANAPDAAAPIPLGFSLTDLHMRMNMAHHMQKSRLHTRAAALGLGPGQPRMLSYIGVHAPCTRADLAAHYRIDPAAVTRMLDALERNGFIASVPARPGADRRKKAVELTERGRATLGLWDVACAQAAEIMTEGFTPDERAQLSDLLERVCRNLAEADRPCAHQVASSPSAASAGGAADPEGALRTAAPVRAAVAAAGDGADADATAAPAASGRNEEAAHA